MKNRWYFFVAVALATGFWAQSSFALGETQSQALRRKLKSVPAAEAPLRAAELVAKADAKDRDEVTAVVVRELLKSHPAIGPAVVSSISRSTPASAATAARVASEVSKSEAPAIARAAITAAPAHARQIASQVTQAAPASASQVNALVAPTPAAKTRSASEAAVSSGGTVTPSSNPINSNRKDATGNPQPTFTGVPQQITPQTLPDNYARH